MFSPFALKKSLRPCSPETTTTSFYIHEMCRRQQNRHNQSNQGLTYVQESKVKQSLICDSKSPGEKVVALPQEGGDVREREMREGGRCILVVLIAATEKQN